MPKRNPTKSNSMSKAKIIIIGSTEEREIAFELLVDAIKKSSKKEVHADEILDGVDDFLIISPAALGTYNVTSEPSSDELIYLNDFEVKTIVSQDKALIVKGEGFGAAPYTYFQDVAKEANVSLRVVDANFEANFFRDVSFDEKGNMSRFFEDDYFSLASIGSEDFGLDEIVADNRDAIYNHYLESQKETPMSDVYVDKFYEGVRVVTGLKSMGVSDDAILKSAGYDSASIEKKIIVELARKQKYVDVVENDIDAKEFMLSDHFSAENIAELVSFIDECRSEKYVFSQKDIGDILYRGTTPHIPSVEDRKKSLAESIWNSKKDETDKPSYFTMVRAELRDNLFYQNIKVIADMPSMFIMEDGKVASIYDVENRDEYLFSVKKDKEGNFHILSSDYNREVDLNTLYEIERTLHGYADYPHEFSMIAEEAIVSNKENVSINFFDPENITEEPILISEFIPDDSNIVFDGLEDFSIDSVYYDVKSPNNIYTKDEDIALPISYTVPFSNFVKIMGIDAKPTEYVLATEDSPQNKINFLIPSLFNSEINGLGHNIKEEQEQETKIKI